MLMITKHSGAWAICCIKESKENNVYQFPHIDLF